MTRHTVILLLAALCATAHAQTIRTLGYNIANGTVVANTGTNVLTFTNNIKFWGGDLQFNNTQIVGNGLYIDFDDGVIGGGPITINTNSLIIFEGAAAAATRTNLGFPLAALTNDSNATMIRALSGSTNTNHPFSGSVSVVGTNNTNTLVFSNGILQSVQ